MFSAISIDTRLNLWKHILTILLEKLLYSSFTRLFVIILVNRLLILKLSMKVTKHSKTPCFRCFENEKTSGTYCENACMQPVISPNVNFTTNLFLVSYQYLYQLHFMMVPTTYCS